MATNATQPASVPITPIDTSDLETAPEDVHVPEPKGAA